MRTGDGGQFKIQAKWPIKAAEIWDAEASDIQFRLLVRLADISGRNLFPIIGD